MAIPPVPNLVDTVIVGNGPSALILSYILHGHIPYYDPSKPHPDPILHQKLCATPCLLDIDVQDLTAHFAASRLSYSTQALPVNVLLDTLLRPLADTDPAKYPSCVQWRYEGERKVQHLVLGNTAQAGGQWADNPVSASWDIGALSYSEMLSLPGYNFGKHYENTYGRPAPEFYRPTRREVATYLAVYPEAVGISDSIYTRQEVTGIRREDGGFRIDSHGICCKHLVLASGTFSNLIPPRPPLQPLNTLPRPNSMSQAPLLVVGSGFTAADVIITQPNRKIIHIFKWDPDNHPSPLRACHPRAYPEYASIYRRMKIAAREALGPQGVISPMRTKKSNPFFKERDWDNVYEGLPNTYIKAVDLHDTRAVLTLETSDGKLIERVISNLEYVIGRRGSLSYIDESIAKEIGQGLGEKPISRALISGRTLRPLVERTLELAPNVFVTGSLTGDSLVRFAYGGCVFAAREIMRPISRSFAELPNMPGNGHLASSSPSYLQSDASPSTSCGLVSGSGHWDLHIDKSTHPYHSDMEDARYGVWPGSRP